MDFLEMSLSGTALVAAIALARLALLRVVPKRTFLVLWAVALLRLLVPFPPMFRVSLPVPEALSAPVAAAESRIEPPAPAVAAPTPSEAETPDVPAASGPAPVIAPPAAGVDAASVQAEPMQTPVPILQMIWFVGMLAVGSLIVCLYGINYRRFRRAVPAECEAVAAWLDAHSLRRPLAIRELSGIDSPLTYGVLRPVILVPAGMDWSDGATRYALEHEYVHTRRFDAAFKIALAAALAVHWFNPAVWLMYALANRDIELSCDEAVLRRFGEAERGSYARALLAMEERRSILPSVYAGFGANTTKERILAIMKFKKASVLSLALAAVLVLSLAACAATGTGAQNTAEKITNKTDATIIGVAENIGETPQDADASAARLYVNDGLQLSVPLEYADLLLVETPQDGEYGTLFVVSEKASVEAAEAEGHDDWGMGWLFSIVRISKAELDEWMTADMSGVSVFAKDADGNCYIRSMPTDVRYYRNEDVVVEDSDGWTQWETLQRWAGTVRGTFLAENPGLTPYTVTNTSVDIYFARLASWDDIEYTLSNPAFGPLPPDGVDAAPYVARLRDGVVFEGADSGETPSGEYFSLFFPDGSGGERFDFFAAGGNYVRHVYGPNGEYQALCKAVYADGETEAADVMQDWYFALAETKGLISIQDYQTMPVEPAPEDAAVPEWLTAP